jgi:phage tail sheath protein FI
MPITQSVGVYSLEQDQSQYQSATSPLNPGVVMRASWGPYNTITKVTSISELIQKFGEPIDSGYTGLIGAKKYFRYGSLLNVVRAESASDAKAGVTLNDASDPSLKIEAKYKGAYGNNISVKTTLGPDNKIQIDVFVKGTLQETFKGLSKSNVTDKNSIYKSTINATSEWITIVADATCDAEASEPDENVTSTLTGGVSALPAKAGFIGTATGGPNSGPSGLQCFASDSVPLNVLLCPCSAALSTESDAKDVSKEIESISDARKDLLGLLDFPAGKSRANAITYADSTAAWNSTYVAAFWPWVQYTEAAIGATGSNVYIPGTWTALINLAKNDILAYPWFAPMGYNGRGNVVEALAVEYNTSRADRDLLHGSQINTFVSEAGVGVVLLGNYTKSAVTKATQSLSIRRGLLFIQLALGAASKALLGEPNDAVTRAQFKSMADKVLSEVQSKRGLNSFLVVCDETNNPPSIVDQRKMVSTIKLQPTKAVEVITLSFQITATGAKFDN